MPAIKPSLFLAFLLACSAARADLDLTPMDDTREIEGVKVTYVTFHDGTTAVTYTPPSGWYITGSHNAAVLSIPDHPQARAFIQSAARVRLPAFDDKATKLFQEKPALLGLPKGCTDISITALTLNPLIIDSHHTLEVDILYSFFGQRCARSLILVDRKGSEVSFTLDCLAPDFNMLSLQFRHSLYSVENL